MTKTPAIAFWLLPEKSAREFFAGTIDELGRRFRAPTFEPHVTICVTPENEPLARQIVREIELPAIELTSRGIKFGEELTKSFFLQFEKNASLQWLADTIARQCVAPLPTVDPHLSLAYAKIEIAAKERSAAELRMPAQVEFDRICAMRCQLPVEDAASIRAWELLACR